MCGMDILSEIDSDPPQLRQTGSWRLSGEVRIASSATWFPA